MHTIRAEDFRPPLQSLERTDRLVFGSIPLSTRLEILGEITLSLIGKKMSTTFVKSWSSSNSVIGGVQDFFVTISYGYLQESLSKDETSCRSWLFYYQAEGVPWYGVVCHHAEIGQIF